MKKKILAILLTMMSFVLSVALGLGFQTKTVSAEETSTSILTECKDISDSSWGAGWYHAITADGNSDGIFVSENKLSLSVSANWFAFWYGPRNGLYASANETFAIEYLTNITTNGFRFRVDQFILDVTPTAVSLMEYNLEKGDGNMNNIEADFWKLAPSTGWFVEKTSTEVNLSGRVEVQFAVKTVDGTTTIAANVGGTEVSYTTTAARVYNNRIFMLCRDGNTVYSKSLLAMENEIDAAVAGMNADAYAANKDAIDAEVNNAKNALWNTNNIGRGGARRQVANVEALCGTYAQKCVDIADASWTSEGCERGWQVIGGGRILDPDVIGVDVNAKNNNNGDDLSYILLWSAAEAGKQYAENDTVAVKFIARATDAGFVFRVDRFCLTVTTTEIAIRVNRSDSHANPAGWLVADSYANKSVSLSGYVEVMFYIATDANKTTTIWASVDGNTIMATPEEARVKSGWVVFMCGANGGNKVYSTSIRTYQSEYESVMKSLDETFYTAHKAVLDEKAAGLEAAMWSNESVYTSDVKNRLQNLKDTIANLKAVDEAIASAKVELDSYVSEADYETADWTTIAGIVAEAKTAVDACETIDAISATVATAKNAIDEVPTAAEREAERVAAALAAAKADAKAELNAYVSEADYETADWATITGIVAEAKTAVDACETIDAIPEKVATAKNAIAEVPTAAEREAERVAAAKEDAKAELDAYVSEADYETADWATITGIVADAKTAVDACETIDAIPTTVATAKNAIDEVPTAAEREAERVAAALAAAKEDAKAELDAYANETDYETADWATITGIVADAKTAVDACETEAAVAEVVATAKSAIDAVEKKAPATSEEPTTSDTTSEKPATSDTTSEPNVSSQDSAGSVVGCFGSVNAIGGMFVILMLAVVLMFARKKEVR